MRTVPSLFKVLVFLVCVTAITGVLGAAETDLPSPTGRVNDYTGTLSAKTRTEVESFLNFVKEKTTAEIAVAVVKTTAPLTVEQYAVELFQKWGVGEKGKDNGVLVLVAKDDRKMRIEVGYGLEGAIPDVTCKDIIDGVMAPSFRNGDFDGGVSGAVLALAKLIAREYNVDIDFTKEAANLPAPSYSTGGADNGWVIALVWIFLVLIIAINSRSKRKGFYWSNGYYGSFGGGSSGGFGGFGGGCSGGGGASGGW